MYCQMFRVSLSYPGVFSVILIALEYINKERWKMEMNDGIEKRVLKCWCVCFLCF